jgi:hypothetical protein
VSRGETVTRLRAKAATNPYSGTSEVRDWTSPDALEVRRVGFEPSGLTMVTVDGATTFRRARFFLPFGADVAEGDRVVRPDGTVYRTTGPRADWTNPLTGRRAGSVIEAEFGQ